MDISIFNYIGETINNATTFFISNTIQNIMDTIKVATTLGVTIYIMLKAYLQIIGKTDALLRDTTIHCLVVISITGLSLNSVHYTTYLISGIENLATGLSLSFTSSIGVVEYNIFKMLDKLLLKAIEQANECFIKMSLWDLETWDWILSAMVILFSIGSVTLLACVIIMGTKFVLTLLFLLGPLFLSLSCFPLTRRFFDAWISKLMENCLIQVFGISIISLSVSIIDNFMASNKLNNNDINPIAISIQITILSGIIFYIIRQIPILSGALSSSFSAAAMTLTDILSPATYTKQLITKTMIEPINNITSKQSGFNSGNIISNDNRKQLDMLNDIISEYVKNNKGKK